MIDHETFNWVLTTGLIVFLIIEIWSYRRYVAAANALTMLGNAMQEAFKAVTEDVGNVNQQLTLMNIRADRLDEAADTLNSNDALIEVYLNLFRDALGLDAEKLSRIGSLKFPEGENPKNLE